MAVITLVRRVKKRINARGVACPVVSQAQMVTAKLVISEPRIETSCPPQMMKNVPNPEATRTIPPPLSSETSHQ